MLAKKMTKLAAAAGLIAMTAVPAMAQEQATTLDQLRVLVKPGDTIRVTGADGVEVKGTLEGLSSSELELRVGDGERRLNEAEIRRIRQRRDDSLADGARRGFAVGAVLGALIGVALAHETGAGFAVFTAGLYGGIGAGIGTGLDAMVTHDRTIYNSLGGAPAKHVAVKLASW
jgi:hypothetical protein